MNEKWRKVLFDILKYSIGVILGACGISLTGCVSLPIFNF